MVMYAGQVAEAARTERSSTGPCTRTPAGLMNAFPSVRGPRRELVGIPGSPPDLARPPSGCRFHPRCPRRHAGLPDAASPSCIAVGDAEVRCLLYAEQAKEAV